MKKPMQFMRSDAARLRELLALINLGQREAARVLQVDQRELRRMCAGERDVPRVILLALERMSEKPTED